MTKVLIAILVATAVGLLLLQAGNLHPTTPGCACVGTVTKIHAIQGTGGTNPFANKQVQVEAVVVGDFTQPGGLGGFFVEEEPSDADSNPATSEGLFIRDTQAAGVIHVGDRVCVTGTVAGYGKMTELRDVTHLAICGRGPLPAPVAIILPLSSPTALEQVEGMRVVFPQTLTVTGDYSLGRYGEVTLAYGRLYSHTEIRPGDTLVLYGRASVLSELDARRRGITGDRAHAAAVRAQKEILQEEAEHKES